MKKRKCIVRRVCGNTPWEIAWAGHYLCRDGQTRPHSWLHGTAETEQGWWPTRRAAVAFAREKGYMVKK